ncbi:hypothetical protein G6F29_007255 [Rhizopus arrhizus]|nr:hypothetical protein G6F19_006589 [Rhizopus arrhizus]KAG0833943.1 hypothetical protein G6F18_006544 [Rhizopus arrhizus]KAG0873303.1 hypothetical protein G6F16_004576 [Rhizopus arrhizus]KAG0882767.1 hypothetical protein G6F15_006562 [Rhizopus arrhizus]KAG0940245.1 hypothetical protein G6F30_006822 [Rhizopus arrhizus]
MPPKKKSPESTLSRKKPKISVPDDAQWCLDNLRHLTFRKFIEKFQCLDKCSSQQRYINILSKYISNTQHYERVRKEYKSWTGSADYQRFWNEQGELDIILRTDGACTKFIGSVTEHRLRSLNAKANTVVRETLDGVDDQETTDDTTDIQESTKDTTEYQETACTIDTQENINANDAQETTDDNSLSDDDRSCQLYPTSSITSNNDANVNSDNINVNPWIFRGKNITLMFENYKSVVHDLINKHTKLPLEPYINELAALSHILILNKHQHSSIITKVFSIELLEELAASLSSESMNYNLDFNDQHYMTLTKTITNLSMSIKTREQTIVELTVMSADMDYGLRRLVRGISNLLVHLRWTNSIPIEGGKLRPDAIIAKKQQLEYDGSVGHDEVKVNQGNTSKYLLCMDTLRLAIFNKNAIDVNKLDGSLAFQIHGFNITFFVSRLVANGIYTFFEIAHFGFPQSLDDLPSFISLKNMKLLLGINEAFWRLCRKSDNCATIAGRYKVTLASLETLIDGSKDRARSCSGRYGQ